MFRVYVERSHISLTDQSTHDAPGPALAAWAALCFQRTDTPAAAILAGPSRTGSPMTVLRYYKLHASCPPSRRVIVDEDTPGAWPGLELRAWRKAAGLTQAEFAGIIGIAPNALAMAERGERGVKPALMRLARIAAVDNAKAKV